MDKDQTSAQGDQTQTQPRIIDDPLLASLAEDLSILAKTEQAVQQNQPPEIKPVDEKKPDEAKPAETKPAETKPATVKAGVKQRPDIKKELDDALTRHLADIKPQAQTPPALPDPKKADELDMAGLVDEQIDEIEDARYLEQKDPAQKGYAKKLLDFYKAVDKWVDDHKDDSDRTFDENDEEFTSFIQENKPKWAPGQRDKIRKARLIDEAKREALKDLQPEIDAAKREAREARVTPVMDRKVNQFTEAFDKAATSDDPLEKDVFGRYKDSAVALASDWVRLAEGVDDITKPKNQEQAGRHKWLMEFIGHQSSVFDSLGGENKVRDGRQFVTPVKFAELASSGKDTSKVWTFNNDDVLTMLQTHMIESAKSQVKAEEEVAVKRGFVRQRPQAAAKPAEEPKPVTGVRASASAAPGAVPSNQTDDTPHPGKEVISILGL
jgi:hypothetical protein